MTEQGVLLEVGQSKGRLLYFKSFILDTNQTTQDVMLDPSDLEGSCGNGQCRVCATLPGAAEHLLQPPHGLLSS